MCIPSAPKPQAAPPPIQVEKLVAKTAEDIKPAKQKPTRKRGKRFNLRQSSAPTFSGTTQSSVSSALGIKRNVSNG